MGKEMLKTNRGEMMENGKMLRELFYPGTIIRIIESKYVAIGCNARIYFHNLSAGSGFDFYITDFASCDSHFDDHYSCPDVRVECLFHGTCYYDGLRHLYMGHKETDNENYLYCLNTVILAEVFKKLNELELKLCNKSMIETKVI